MSPELAKRFENALEYLLNGTGDREGGPYITVTPEQLEARNEDARAIDGDVSHDIPLRISDDCSFVTVHGFEGQPCFGTAEAIEDAGRLIYDLRAALQECETERHNYILAHRFAEEARSKLSARIDRIRERVLHQTCPVMVNDVLGIIDGEVS